MRWYDQLFFLGVGPLNLATPVAVLYGASWWRDHDQERGWRIGVSKFGIAYSILILAGMIAFLACVPRSQPEAEFPYAYRWTPVLACCSAPCLLFATLGKGRVRIALAIVALGGVSFSITILATL